MRDAEEDPTYGFETLKINGIVTDSQVRKVAEIAGSKGVIRNPIQWLIDIMNSENYIEIKRVTEPDGKRYIIIDRVKGEK